MKAEFVSKIFAFFFCLMFFVSAIAAQEKPQVIEVGQVWVRPNETEIDRLTLMLGKFVNRLVNEPETTRGFINVPLNVELGAKIKAFLTNAGIEESRVGYLSDAKHPKYHNFSNIHFLIVPQGAEIPPPFNRPPCICPWFDIIAPEIVTDKNPVLTFKAKVGDGDIEELSYNWTVTAGKIVEGQGTPTIKVDAQGAKEITATVQIGGFCDTCARTTSATTKIQ